MILSLISLLEIYTPLRLCGIKLWLSAYLVKQEVVGLFPARNESDTIAIDPSSKMYSIQN